LDRIGNVKGGDSAIHNNFDNGNAADAADALLPRLSGQAEALRAFFEEAKTSYPELAAKFGALQTAEANIENKANKTNGLLTYRSTVDAQRDAILNEIFAGDAATRAEFDKYFDAYAKGQYLITADWNTRPAGDVTIAEDAFKAARSQLVNISSTLTGKYTVGRGVADLNIGKGSSVTQQFDDMMKIMKAYIVAQLGVTGAEESKAQTMAEALIIQLGQDNEEFRAFVDDLQAEGLNTALNYDYTKAGYVNVASVGVQR
jgi:hypothetical protein